MALLEVARAIGAPDAITEKFGDDRWVFVGWTDRERTASNRATSAARRRRCTPPATCRCRSTRSRDAGVPYVYSLEGDVEDVSRQHIANRASLIVHPAPWYVGLRRPAYFLEQKAGLKTEVVAVGLDGTAAAGVPVDVTLTQVQWTSVRRAEGNGFYTWETERKEIPAGSWTVTTRAPSRCRSTSRSRTAATTSSKRAAAATTDASRVTRTSFYVLGDGYTAWARFDHNRIELVPERQTYKPGDTARIMIQSPWEQATALVTTEREGIRSHRQFALTSTQQSIVDPDHRERHPQRVRLGAARQGTDQRRAGGRRRDRRTATTRAIPGKPSFRLGYVELKVEDRTKRLDASTVTADQRGVPAGGEGQRARSTSRIIERPRRRQRGDAVGRGLRRAVAHRLPARPTSPDRSTCASRCR